MTLFEEPNKFTKKPSFTCDMDKAIIKGYHSYKLTKKYIEPYGNIKKIHKHQLIRSIIIRNIKDKTVNDLGCANGMYSLLCSFHGAKHINAVDIDKKHLEILDKSIKFVDIKNIDIYESNIQDFGIKADVTIALAIIHWIYSCTSYFGSFDEIMKWFKFMTKETIILEWINPNDPNIATFKHLNYNKEIIKEKYNKTNFLKSLKIFKSHELIGMSTETRELYEIKI